MHKINKQNRNRLIDKENRLTAVRGEGVRGLSEKGEGIKKKIIDTDNSMEMTRGKGGVRGGRSGGKGRSVVMEGGLTLDGEHAIQYTAGVL